MNISVESSFFPALMFRFSPKWDESPKTRPTKFDFFYYKLLVTKVGRVGRKFLIYFIRDTKKKHIG